MCPAWHNEEWPDDECDDPAHGCHQAAQYRRDRRAENPNWYDPVCGAPGEPGPPGPPRQRWSSRPGRPLLDGHDRRRLHNRSWY